VKRWARRWLDRAPISKIWYPTFLSCSSSAVREPAPGDCEDLVFRVTENVFRSRMRRGFIRRLLFNRHQETLVSLAPSPSTPQEEIERRERHVRLYQALDQLPDVTGQLSFSTRLKGFRVKRMAG